MYKRMICAKRRNDFGRRIRKAYEKHQYHAKWSEISDLVVLDSNICGAVTTFSHDNMICVIKG